MATSIQRSLIGANTEDSIAVEAMPIQPLLSQLHRVSEALEVIGAPLSAEQQRELNRVKNSHREAIKIYAKMKLEDEEAKAKARESELKAMLASAGLSMADVKKQRTAVEMPGLFSN